MKPTLTIIGGGPGNIRCLTQEARYAIQNAALIYAPARLADAYSCLNSDIRAAGIQETLEQLADPARDAAVIVSGDCGFHSAARLLKTEFEDKYSIEILSGISSLQYLCGKLGIAWNTVKTVSLHATDFSFLGTVGYNHHTFLLTGGQRTPRWILEQLCHQGLGHLRVAVGENLSSPQEAILAGTAEALSSRDYAALSVVLVENPAPANPARRLRDSDFIRGDVPMTKEPIRALATNMLDVSPGDVVWDIGAGTGSVSVALAYAAREGTVCAIERNPDALALLERNRAKLGAYNITVVPGHAPEALADLPPPDKVFIGGSGNRMDEILSALTTSLPCFDLCLTAIALETVSQAGALLENLGFLNIEIQSVNVACARKAGSHHLMTAQNPVTLFSGRWQR